MQSFNSHNRFVSTTLTMVQTSRSFASCSNSTKEKTQQMDAIVMPQMAVAFDLHMTSSPLELEVINSFQRFQRPTRSISECLSEDSYIIFDDTQSDSDLGSSSSFDDVSEDRFKQHEDVDCSDEHHFDFGLKIPTKKVVHFSKEAPIIHHIVAWSFAYRASRKGDWEEFARDRHRFQRRIASCERSLAIIFSAQHREKVFRERFQSADECNAKGRRRRRSRKRRGRGRRRRKSNKGHRKR